jgi:hypothetical protein
LILPSGGTIQIELESDDYSSVQHKDAMQMMKIIGVGNASNQFTAINSGGQPSFTSCYY